MTLAGVGDTYNSTSSVSRWMQEAINIKKHIQTTSKPHFSFRREQQEEPLTRIFTIFSPTFTKLARGE